MIINKQVPHTNRLMIINKVCDTVLIFGSAGAILFAFQVRLRTACLRRGRYRRRRPRAAERLATGAT